MEQGAGMSIEPSDLAYVSGLVADVAYVSGLVAALDAVKGVSKSPTLGQQKMIAAIEALIEESI